MLLSNHPPPSPPHTHTHTLGNSKALVRLHSAIEAMVAWQISREGPAQNSRGLEADDDAFVDAIARMLQEAERSSVVLNLK